MNSDFAYGPVPSRRLGRSLGINNIPPKICSYSCVYCQLGHTKNIQIKRQIFYQPQQLARSVEEKVNQLREEKEPVDYLAFVPDGEPTLDINLGKEIELLRTLDIKIAVITNASLIRHDDVKEDLKKADWVSLKVDSVSPQTWQKINRPQKNLELETTLQGIIDFASLFKGELTTETMLVKGINDDPDEINKIAGFLSKLKPTTSYLAVPTRPPADRIEPATEQTLNDAYQLFSQKLSRVEYLIGYEGNAFTSTGDAAEDLLSITAVHPMREEAVIELLNRLNKNWKIVQELINNGRLLELNYKGKKFYARKLTVKIPRNKYKVELEK